MRTGKVPHAIEEDALDTYLVLLADHSYNASTFAARVAASTRADIYASVTAALATLQGDLHGGAATAAFRTLSEVKSPENAEPYVRAILDRGQRIMGMGHREYKVRDPRARHLEAMAKELSAHVGGDRWYETAHAIEEASRKVLQEKSPATRSTRTSTSIPHRFSPTSASRVTSSRVSLRVGASRAGPLTSSSNSPTTASFGLKRPTMGPLRGPTCRSKSARQTASEANGSLRCWSCRRSTCAAAGAFA